MPADTIDNRGYIKVNNQFKSTSDSVTKLFAFGNVSNFDDIKGAARVSDQSPFVASNVKLFLDGKPLKQYNPGFKGKVMGPLLVTIGSNHKDQYGVGPYLPSSCLNFCCFLCCCAGGPCHVPAGSGVAKMKFDWNNTMNAQSGYGISDHPIPKVPTSSKISDNDR